MSDGAKTLLVILLIPFLFAVGHDIYINYLSDDEKIKEVKALRIDPEKFLVSDMGWVWSEHSPNTMQAVRDSMEPETWQSSLDPVLQLPTMVIGIIPWAMTIVYFAFAWLAGFWPYTGRSFSSGKKRKKEDFSVYKNAKTKKVKYSKK